MNLLEEKLKTAKIISIVCNQFGDTGKGKFSDYLAATWADITARGTGGNNAGHTVVVNGIERIFHLLPAGIAQDSAGKVTMMGNGMVIDPKALVSELDELDAFGGSYDNLIISEDAHVTMPYHIQLDKAKNQSQKGGGIGSTGRGIGPTYTDKTARRGITIGNLLDRDVLARKIDGAKEIYSDQEIDKESLIETLTPYIEKIRPLVRNTVSEMHKFARQGKKILIEGAQGLILSNEHGIHPYVTSSDCSQNGTANGVGLPAKAVDLPIGIVKFPFMSRVGGGPLPAEFGGSKSEERCSQEIEKIHELKEFGIPHKISITPRSEEKISYDHHHKNIINLMNSSDPFIQGIGVRLAAGEYGATTGRPRRTAWTDAVAAKYAVGINGPLMILTKADCLAGMNEFNIGFSYEINGSRTEEFSRDIKTARSSNSVLKRYQGYGDIDEIKQYSHLPKSLKSAISDFEEFTQGYVIAVSVGADREETIFR